TGTVRSAENAPRPQRAGRNRGGDRLLDICRRDVEHLRSSANRSLNPVTQYDVIIRGGTVYDGSGWPAFGADVAIHGDTIAAIGALGADRGRTEIDATGRAVAPGFINMLSWATESLIADGRSQSDIRQGVTLEVFGEGVSLGPLNDDMKRERRERQSDIHYDIDWTTLDDGLESLVRRGVSCNVA